MRVVTIEPGFVDTPLKAHLRGNPPWATPERVARDIVRAIDQGRRVLYMLGLWRLVLGAIRHVPESMFSRLKQ